MGPRICARKRVTSIPPLTGLVELQWGRAYVRGKGPTLANTDVVLGTVNAEGLIESPNAVNIDRSTLLGDGDILRIQDVPRVQAEDARAWEIRVPGIDDAPAVGLAVDMLALSDGQQAVRIGVRPGFAEGLGSLLRFDAELAQLGVVLRVVSDLVAGLNHQG